MDTLTTPSHGLDRARPRVSSCATELPTMGSWLTRDAFAPCGTTGPITGVNTLSNPTTGANGQTIKRPARLLEPRST